MALEGKPKQADRLRMDGCSAVPSPALIRFLNEPDRSDSVVLFLRGLTALYMLTHQQDFALLQMQFEESEAERSVATAL